MQRHLSWQGRDRVHLLRLPAGEGPFPVIIVLPGAGGTAEWTEGEIGLTGLARRENFAVVYAEGTPPHAGRPMRFLSNPALWNDGSPRASRFTLPDDLAYLDALLDSLPPEIDRQRVYVTGFSNGAGMAFRWAAASCDRIAAVAPVAGHCWVGPGVLKRAVPTLYLIGEADPLIPLAGGEVRTPWGDREVKPAVADTLDRWSAALAGRAPLESHVVAGLGHHWPGGRGELNPRFAGPAKTDFDADAAIWAFFRRAGTLTG